MTPASPNRIQRVVSPVSEEIVGPAFMQRLRLAAARVQPMSMQVAMAFAEGPEFSAEYLVRFEEQSGS